MTPQLQTYLDGNPHAVDSIWRATVAYHQNHRERGAHHFSGSAKDCACRWCGITREGVRWGDGAPECAARPEWADQSIGGVIAREEALFERVIESAREYVASTDVTRLTGSDLSVLHHTFGIDPTILDAALNQAGRPMLTQAQHDAYQTEYQKHRKTGADGQRKAVLIAH